MRYIKIIIGILLALCLLVLGLFFLYPDQSKPAAEIIQKYQTPQSHFFNWRGAKIHYRDRGTGFPILMIHGFGGCFRNFDSLGTLMQNDYRVIQVDLPGFGLSDFPTVKQDENYIQDYKDFMQIFCDSLHLDSLYLIGNSMGGMVSWMAAAENPTRIKKIVLLNSAGYDAAEAAAKLAIFRYKNLGKLLEKSYPLALTKRGMAFVYADPSRLDMNDIEANNEIINKKGNVHHMLNLAAASQFPDESKIKDVQCPTLIIWGAQDKIVPPAHAERFHHDIKGSEVKIIDPCGHCPMIEKPIETEQYIRAFLGGEK